jgi:hypothetical protein
MDAGKCECQKENRSKSFSEHLGVLVKQNIGIQTTILSQGDGALVRENRDAQRRSAILKNGYFFGTAPVGISRENPLIGIARPGQGFATFTFTPCLPDPFPPPVADRITNASAA